VSSLVSSVLESFLSSTSSLWSPSFGALATGSASGSFLGVFFVAAGWASSAPVSDLVSSALLVCFSAEGFVAFLAVVLVGFFLVVDLTSFLSSPAVFVVGFSSFSAFLLSYQVFEILALSWASFCQGFPSAS